MKKNKTSVSGAGIDPDVPDTLPFGLFTTDAQLRIVSVNAVFRRQLIEMGIDQEPVGQDLEKFLPEWPQHIRDGYVQLLSQSAPFFRAVLPVQNFPLELQLYPSPDAKGKVIRIVTTVRNLSEKGIPDLDSSEKDVHYSEVVDNMTSGVAIYRTENEGEDFIFQSLNKAAERIERVKRKDVIGKSVLEVFPGITEFGLFDVFQRVYRTGKPISHPITFYRDESIIGWVENYVFKLPNGEIVNVYEDITDRKRDEKKIKDSLREKEVLLKEIHHRVKNNMQIICSLLNLQADQIVDEKARTVYRNSQDRIRSMALIHEKLYQSRDLARIDFKGYVDDLVSYLTSVYGIDSSKITLKPRVSDIYLGIDTAIPLALIINELVSNSIKHAFKDRDSGEIWIEFLSEQNDDSKKRHYVLEVGDNGVGLPKNLDIRDIKTFGLDLVLSLTEQVDGKLSLDLGRGTTFQIRFAQ